jgi:hypothetical protein
LIKGVITIKKDKLERNMKSRSREGSTQPVDVSANYGVQETYVKWAISASKPVYSDFHDLIIVDAGLYIATSGAGKSTFIKSFEAVNIPDKGVVHTDRLQPSEYITRMFGATDKTPIMITLVHDSNVDNCMLLFKGYKNLAGYPEDTALQTDQMYFAHKNYMLDFDLRVGGYIVVDSLLLTDLAKCETYNFTAYYDLPNYGMISVESKNDMTVFDKMMSDVLARSVSKNQIILVPRGSLVPDNGIVIMSINIEYINSKGLTVPCLRVSSVDTVIKSLPARIYKRYQLEPIYIQPSSQNEADMMRAAEIAKVQATVGSDSSVLQCFSVR